MDAIEARNLTKRYGDLLAVDRVSFAVREGEIFGLLGPNGAGKTTTIRMLTGLTRPTSGTALVDSLDLAHNPLAAKERIGVVSDVASLYDELSAWDNLQFVARLHGMGKERRLGRAEELLRLFGLYDRRHHRAGTFSTGLKKRMLIAAALIHEPQILFLDEPTTGLDIQSARLIRGLIGELTGKVAAEERGRIEKWAKNVREISSSTCASWPARWAISALCSRWPSVTSPSTDWIQLGCSSCSA